VHSTPLMQAAFEGHDHIVNYLALQCGGDVNAQTIVSGIVNVEAFQGLIRLIRMVRAVFITLRE
jgi:hypothetical protein